MHITGGRYKGLNVKTAKTMSIRPTTAKVREAVFGILGSSVEGASFLDVFAGSGIMGLEALSRGAALVSFVDSSHQSVSVIRENLARLKALAGRSRINKSDAVRFLSQDSGYDIIYIDPPYKSSLREETLRALDTEQGRFPQTVIIRTFKKYILEYFPAFFTLDSERNYGDMKLYFFHRSPRNENTAGR